MKRTQVAALVAGMTVGVGGVALGIVLARQEGREAARRFLDQYGIGEKSAQAAQTLAVGARKVGEQVAKTASEQYEAQLPRALDAWSTIVAQAPQAANMVTAAISRGTMNGKHEVAANS